MHLNMNLWIGLQVGDLCFLLRGIIVAVEVASVCCWSATATEPSLTGCVLHDVRETAGSLFLLFVHIIIAFALTSLESPATPLCRCQ
jgi:hypothetical protein